MKLRVIPIGLMALSLLAPSLAWAQAGVGGPANTMCLEDLYDSFGREHRIARAVLFGRPDAYDASIGTVFYDQDGDPWIKTSESDWKTTRGEEGETIGNGEMNGRSEEDLLCDGENSDEIERSCVRFPRRGIFEMRKAPTSDLVSPIVQTVRALECRLRAICELSSESQGKNEGEMVTITLDGCLPMTFPAMNGCREADPTLFDTLPGMCASARKQLVTREMDLLTLTASYDASYRSLAQFAGMFQEFLTQFRFPLIEPIWQMVRMLGGLNGIPCFQAECNE